MCTRGFQRQQGAGDGVRIKNVRPLRHTLLPSKDSRGLDVSEGALLRWDFLGHTRAGFPSGSFKPTGRPRWVSVFRGPFSGHAERLDPCHATGLYDLLCRGRGSELSWTRTLAPRGAGIVPVMCVVQQGCTAHSVLEARSGPARRAVSNAARPTSCRGSKAGPQAGEAAGRDQGKVYSSGRRDGAVCTWAPRSSL